MPNAPLKPPQANQSGEILPPIAAMMPDRSRKPLRPPMTPDQSPRNFNGLLNNVPHSSPAFPNCIPADCQNPISGVTPPNLPNNQLVAGLLNQSDMFVHPVAGFTGMVKSPGVVLTPVVTVGPVLTPAGPTGCSSMGAPGPQRSCGGFTVIGRGRPARVPRVLAALAIPLATTEAMAPRPARPSPTAPRMTSARLPLPSL